MGTENCGNKDILEVDRTEITETTGTANIQDLGEFKLGLI